MAGYIIPTRSVTMQLPGAWDQIAAARAATRGLGALTQDERDAATVQMHTLSMQMSELATDINQLPAAAHDAAQAKWDEVIKASTAVSRVLTATDVSTTAVQSAISNLQDKVDDVQTYIASHMGTSGQVQHNIPPATRPPVSAMPVASSVPSSGLSDWAWYAIGGVGLAAIGAGVYFFTKKKGRRR